MSIKIIIDTTEATTDETKRLDELLEGKEFLLTTLFNDENIEVFKYTKRDNQIAKDNNCTISVGLNPSVIYGNMTRELAESLYKESKKPE